jgi:hypothetical protein
VRDGSALHLWQGEQPANILLLVGYFSGNIIAQTDGFILANNSILAGNNLGLYEENVHLPYDIKGPFLIFDTKFYT